MEVIRYCTCNRQHDHIHSGFCSSCGSSYRRRTSNTSMRASSSSSSSSSQTTTTSGVNGGFEHHGGSSSSFMYCYLPKLIFALLSGALTGLFALGNLIITCLVLINFIFVNFGDHRFQTGMKTDNF
ncbi:hypothetical protein FRX31_020304 [Thalictrum thalictroides]|uniref:Transmembrane protein n=1 Tax=Thalictrum thalictroides TaxID=46969 RepID=A0A7J6W009_THATH|nr:hypothetical protein FRX31_020304 [Thalictrum thalictroides]